MFESLKYTIEVEEFHLLDICVSVNNKEIHVVTLWYWYW